MAFGLWLRGARRGAALALLPALAASQGCYTYQPTRLARLSPGEQIRVELGERMPRSLMAGTAAATGPRRLEGRFGRLTGDSLAVAVWIGEAYAGTPFESAYQDVMVPLDEVVRVENRRLNRGRTALVGAATLAVIAYLIDSIGEFHVFGGGGGEPPPPPPAGLRAR